MASKDTTPPGANNIPWSSLGKQKECEPQNTGRLATMCKETEKDVTKTCPLCDLSLSGSAHAKKIDQLLDGSHTRPLTVTYKLVSHAYTELVQPITKCKLTISMIKQHVLNHITDRAVLIQSHRDTLGRKISVIDRMTVNDWFLQRQSDAPEIFDEALVFEETPPSSFGNTAPNDGSKDAAEKMAMSAREVGTALFTPIASIPEPSADAADAEINKDSYPNPKYAAYTQTNGVSDQVLD